MHEATSKRTYQFTITMPIDIRESWLETWIRDRLDGAFIDMHVLEFKVVTNNTGGIGGLSL